MWRAVYEVEVGDGRGGTRKVPYEVDVESRECPVARLESPAGVEAMRLLEEFGRAKRVKEATGGVLYGPDSSRWPARWFDAVDVIEGEVQRTIAALQGAGRR